MTLYFEPRYSKEAIEGLERMYQKEKKKGLIHLRSEDDVDRLLKKSSAI